MDASRAVKTHQACDKCGSHDALARYTDGHTYCFSCGSAEFPGGGHKAAQREAEWEQQEEPIDYKFTPIVAPQDPQGQPKYVPLNARKITAETCERYDYQVQQINGETVQVANYHDNQGKTIGQKIRNKDKKFRITGHISERFYGQDKWPGGESLVITEGEIDCLSVAQATGYRQPVVSLPTGAQSAAKVIEANIEWLDSFNKIIIMTDMDKPGREAAQKIAERLPAGKAYIANLSEKDANDCLKAGKGGEICEAVARANAWRPEDFLTADDVLKALEDPGKVTETDSIPWEIPLAQLSGGGVRKDEMLIITAGTGIGKSTLTRQLAHWLAVVDGRKVGLMMLEESPRLTALKILGIHLGKRLKSDAFLTADKTEKAALMQAYNDVFGSGQMIIYNHFGSLSPDTLLAKMRYMVTALKVDYIVLDHVSIAVAATKSQDKRAELEGLMTNMRTLVSELGHGLICVSHLSRTDGTPAEEGGRVTLSMLRGTHNIGQAADMVWALERNTQATDPELTKITTVRVLKAPRQVDDVDTGTGIGGYLRMNKETGLLEAVEKEKAATLAEMLADQMSPAEKQNGYKSNKQGQQKPQGAVPKTWAEMGVEVGPIVPTEPQKQPERIEENPFKF